MTQTAELSLHTARDCVWVVDIYTRAVSSVKREMNDGVSWHSPFTQTRTPEQETVPSAFQVGLPVSFNSV